MNILQIVVAAALITVFSHNGFTSETAEETTNSDELVAPKAPINLVIEPEFEGVQDTESKTDESEQKPEKLQFEPVTDDLPLLEERTVKAEEKRGSFYEEGSELHISPEPGIALTDEEIVEDNLEQQNNEEPGPLQ